MNHVKLQYIEDIISESYMRLYLYQIHSSKYKKSSQTDIFSYGKCPKISNTLFHAFLA